MKKILPSLLLLLSLFLFTSIDAQEGLSINDSAPDFTSKDQTGKTVNLKELLKQGSVVLVFYRGEWCPYCNKQLSQLEDSMALIKGKGARLIAVSPEKQENVAKTVQKTKATYSILSDDNLKIMSAYKVAFELDSKTNEKYKGYGINVEESNGNNGRNLPIPAVYIIGKDGKIKYRYFDADYKKRVSVKEILENL